MGSSPRRHLLLVLLAAGALRLAQAWRDPDAAVRAGPAEYGIMAANLVERGTLSFDGETPSAFRLPAYPLLAAGAFAATGQTRSTAPVFALNIGLTFLSVLAAFLVARRLLEPPWAVAVAALVGLNPELAELDWRVGPEPLFTLEYVLAALTALRVLEAPGQARRWATCGAVLGLSLMTRSTLLVWPPILGALLVLSRPGPGAWRRAALLCVCAYAFTAPWIARNKLALGRIVPFEDGMGWHMLWQGSTSVEGIQPDTNLPEPLRTYFFTKDPRIGPASKELALRNIAEDPWRYAGYCVRRIPVMWFRGAWAERSLGTVEAFDVYLARGDWPRAAAKAAFKLIEFAVLAGALAGLAAAWPEPSGRILGLQLLYMNIHVFTMGLPRYMAPAFPLTALFAVVGLRWAWRRAREAR